MTAGERSLTFTALADRAARLAAAIARLTDPGDRVAILAHNAPQYVEALYGVPGSGRVLVLLNYRLHPREWARILDECGARIVIVERNLLAQLTTVDCPAEHIIAFGTGTAGQLDYEELIAAATPLPAWVPVADDDPAVIIFTSGTTGVPKGAVIHHRAVAFGALVSALEWGVGEGERFLMSYPMCHASGFQVFVYHVRCAALILTPAFDPGEFLELIAERRPTRVSLAPTMATFVLNQPGIDRCDLSSIRCLSYGGMPMPVDVAVAMAERFGDLRTGFGQSESTLMVTSLTPGHHRRALEGDVELLSSCGQASPFCHVAVLDDGNRPVPVGDVGELCVRSDMVMRGYWNNPEATREAFGGGWLHTGDLARVDGEGFVYLVDRKKDMLISGGQNVYPREIELVIATLPGVADVAVTGSSDPVWGERVAAFVVRAGDARVTEEDVQSVCTANLAGYKKPRIVRFVDDLPRNALGKVVKPVLRQQLEGGPRNQTGDT